jgi:hypothetical protein
MLVTLGTSSGPFAGMRACGLSSVDRAAVFTGDESRDTFATPDRRLAMSLVVRFPPSNVTKQQYDAVRGALTASGDWPPDGCELHVCFGDESNIRVSEIWESREKLDAFGQKLMPRLEEAGIQLSGEPEILEAHVVDKF